MDVQELQKTAQAIVADGKGILAADESGGTIKKRFDSIGVESRPRTRGALTATSSSRPRASRSTSAGVILFDETIRQSSADGTPFPKLLESKESSPGSKWTRAQSRSRSAEGETVTEGLDGLRERLNEYRELGARFAKWRAVITIGDEHSQRVLRLDERPRARPLRARCVRRRASSPIVEPRSSWTATTRSSAASKSPSRTLHAVFTELRDQRVAAEGILLKPNMVLPGYECSAAGLRRRDRRTRPLRCFLSPRSCGRAGDRLPLRRPVGRGGDQQAERDERARPAPVEAVVLLRPCASGGCAQGLGWQRGRTSRRHSVPTTTGRR